AVLTTATTNVTPSGKYGTNTGGNAYVPGSPMWTAENIAHQNKAGGVNITVPDADVTFGYIDQNGNSLPLRNHFPNTMTVGTSRDPTGNNRIDLFLGPAYKKAQQSRPATATATIYAGDVSSLKKIPGVDAHVLPIAYDYKMWQTFASSGLSPDGNKYLNTDN